MINAKQKQMLKSLENVLGNIEMDVKRLKMTLSQLQNSDAKDAKGEESAEIVVIEKNSESNDEENVKVIEGKFDGYFMVGDDQKKYPVPLNYSSKTKLVPGDRLKLKIMDDGKLIYKLIQPAERKHLKAVLSLTDENKFIAITDNAQTYFLNQAAVTFFKGKAGDELYIITNMDGTGGFAAIEAVIQK